VFEVSFCSCCLKDKWLQFHIIRESNFSLVELKESRYITNTFKKRMFLVHCCHSGILMCLLFGPQLQLLDLKQLYCLPRLNLLLSDLGQILSGQLLLCLPPSFTGS